LMNLNIFFFINIKKINIINRNLTLTFDFKLNSMTFHKGF